ncbi:hypothetical protein D9M68_822230 [compost metagenome]
MGSSISGAGGGAFSASSICSSVMLVKMPVAWLAWRSSFIPVAGSIRPASSAVVTASVTVLALFAFSVSDSCHREVNW